MPLEDYAERPRPTRADLREIERRTGLPYVPQMERLPDRRAFLLPIAPTTNNLYIAVRGRRIKAPGYRQWLTEAGWKLKLQGVQPLQGKSFALAIAAPVNHGRDLGNILKATEDLIVEIGIIPDDRWIDSIRLDRITPGADGGKEMYVTLKVLV